MAKQFINEAFRMQQLAGLVSENEAAPVDIASKIDQNLDKIEALPVVQQAADKIMKDPKLMQQFQQGLSKMGVDLDLMKEGDGEDVSSADISKIVDAMQDKAQQIKEEEEADDRGGAILRGLFGMPILVGVLDHFANTGILDTLSKGIGTNTALLATMAAGALVGGIVGVIAHKKRANTVQKETTNTAPLNEVKRMQQLAGLINENYVDLGAINSPFMESEEVNEADAGMKAVEDKIKSGKIDPKEVEAAAKKAMSGDTTELAQLMVQAMGMKLEATEDDDIDDVESDEEEPDYFSNKPGKKDEFDTDDDIEPAAKDVTAGDAIAKSAGGKQGKLNMLMKQKDAILNKFKSGQITIDQYKAEIGDIPMQIKKLQADIDRDLSIDDEEEI